MDSVLYCIPTHRVGKGLANYVLYGLYIQPYIFCCHLLVYIYPYITSSAPDRSHGPKRTTCSYGTSPTFRCAFQTPPAGFTCCRGAVSSLPREGRPSPRLPIALFYAQLHRLVALAPLSLLPIPHTDPLRAIACGQLLRPWWPWQQRQTGSHRSAPARIRGCLTPIIIEVSARKVNKQHVRVIALRKLVPSRCLLCRLSDFFIPGLQAAFLPQAIKCARPDRPALDATPNP